MSDEPAVAADTEPTPAPDAAAEPENAPGPESPGPTGDDIPDTPVASPDGLNESGMWDTAGNAIDDADIPATPTGEEGEDAIPTTPKGEDDGAQSETAEAISTAPEAAAEPAGEGDIPATPKGEEEVAAEPAGEGDIPSTPKGEEEVAAEPAGEEDIPSTPKGEEEVAAEPAGEGDIPTTPKGEEEAVEAEQETAAAEEPTASNEPLGIDAAMEDEEYADASGARIEPALIHEHEGLLGSPRCKDAMTTQGILKADLQPRPLSSFKPQPPLVATKEQQQMRFEHFEKRRLQKCNLVLSTRHELVQLQAAGKWPPPAPPDNSELSTMIVKERERAASSKKRMIDRNAQLKAHETRRSELRAQKLLEIDFIEKREKDRKAQAIVEAQKSEKEREVRAQKMKADAKAKQLQLEKDAEVRRLEAAKKQEEKLVRQEERKKAKAEIQAEKTRAAQIRIEAVLEADKRNIQLKHERAEQKKIYLAERMKENERIAALEQLKRDEEAAVKAAKVEACRQRERDTEVKRLADFDAKKRELLQRLEEKDKIEQIARVEHERQVEIKHHHQLAARTEAAEKKERTRKDRLEKQQNKEVQYQEMITELQHTRLIASETRMLDQLDRQDFRERHDRIAEKQRQEALDAINRATEQTQARLRDQNQLLQERQEQRKLAHIDKGLLEFDNSTPGPGEYNTIGEPICPCAVIAKKLPMDAQDIPGPSHYDVNFSQKLPYNGAMVMGQTKNITALDQYISYYGKIPAANAYDIPRELNGPCSKISKGNMPGDIELRMKVGSKIPAPHDYSPLNTNWDNGTHFCKAKLPDPQDTPQRENPSPFVYRVNMESVWGARPNPDCNSAGDKSYLTGLQTWASKLPGPGTYQVSTEGASGIGEAEDLSPAEKRQMGGYMAKMLKGKWSAAHTPIDCARLTPPKATVL